MSAIRAAGIALDLWPLDPDQRWSTRILHRIAPSPYLRRIGSSSLRGLLRLVTDGAPDFIFLNQVSLAALAPALRSRLPPASKIVVLSHGLESTDLLHLIRLRRLLPLGGRIGPSETFALGRTILSETDLRTHVDVVCALSEFDEQLENWVGAKRVGWLPRIIEPQPLVWRPGHDRLGFVGTLDHAPNLEGLVGVLDELDKKDVGTLRIRVVGEPTRIGRWLASRYRVVDYLGCLDDETLSREAASWNAFLHPIFCHARGCSTKLATAIGWEIPIITTNIGRRGYRWKSGDLLMAKNPADFADLCFSMLDPEFAASCRVGAIEVARTSPRLHEVANQLRELIGAPAQLQ